MRSRILLQWLGGTLGGLLGWLLTEPFPFFNPEAAPGMPEPSILWPRIILFGVVTGAAISACIAAAYGAGSRARLIRSALIGAGAGMVGGGLGLAVGQLIYQTIQVPSEFSMVGRAIAPVSILGQIMARSLGWAAVGAGMGLLQGAINGSVQRSRNGLIGGTVGGFIGGAIFELLVQTVNISIYEGRSPLFFLSGSLLRAISLTVTGSAIGLFVGLTERAFRNAWVRVRAGRNEGAEFLLEKAESTVGRDELSDVPLFGDTAVNRHHATIKRAGSGYMVEANAPGVVLNGQAVKSAPLSDGDVITIATREVEFHQKGAPRAIPAVDTAKPAIAPVPVPEGICPYCGERRGLQGECACSPVAAARPTPNPPAAPVVPTTTGAPRLVGLAGPLAGRSIALDRAETTVGREPGRDVMLTDPAVSRHHARLLVDAGQVEVLDEGSANGTFVNGQRVERRPLRPGDEVRFGGSAFRLDAA